MEVTTSTIPLENKFPIPYHLFASQPQVKVFSQYPATQIDQFLEEETIEEARLKQLETDIGKGLFARLTEADKEFILETEGTIYLGYEAEWADLKRIFKYIEKYGK